MWLEGLPSRGTWGGGRGDLEATEKWHLALLPEATQRFHYRGYWGRNGPENQQQVLGALETLRQLAACPGEEKGPKKEAAEEVRWVRVS